MHRAVMRRSMGMAMIAGAMIAALARPWAGGTAEARPARAAACRADEVSRLKAQLAETQAALAVARRDLASARDTVARMLEAERRRAQKLAEQLGAPLMETLKGADGLN